MIIREIAVDSRHGQRLVRSERISVVIDIIHLCICSGGLCEGDEAGRGGDEDAGFVWVVGGLGGDYYVGALCYVGFCCLLEVVGEGVDGLGDTAGNEYQKVILEYEDWKGFLTCRCIGKSRCHCRGNRNGHCQVSWLHRCDRTR